MTFTAVTHPLASFTLHTFSTYVWETVSSTIEYKATDEVKHEAVCSCVSAHMWYLHISIPQKKYNQENTQKQF